MNKLFEDNINIVYYCFNKLIKTDFVLSHEEDLKQEGLLALWKSVLQFDSTKSEKFSTYAFPSVKNSMLKWIRDNCREDYCSLDESLNTGFDNEENLTLKDIIPVNIDFDSLTDLKQDLLNKYDCWLKQHHRTEKTAVIKFAQASIILNELLSNPNTTQVQIQHKYNIHRNVVSKILSELRLFFKEDYPTLYQKSKKQNNM